MQENRYILEKYNGKNRFTCPACGKLKQFSLYFDIEKKEYLGDHVGKCNRIDKCAYHFTPKQFFDKNNITAGKPTFTPPVQKPKEMYLFPFEWMEQSLTHYPKNTFACCLRDYFGENEAMRLLTLYECIGTSLRYEGCVIFWQIDTLGRVRTGKIMKYKPDFHREQFTTWVHTKLIPDYQELRQCFFGEHLLRDKTKKVAIVESEKTAVICSHFMPDFIWLAAGNIHGLTERKMQCLRDRTVILYPDLGKGYKVWKQKAIEYKHIPKSITVSEHLNTISTPEQKSNGLDLADFFLMNYKPINIHQNENTRTTANAH